MWLVYKYNKLAVTKGSSRKLINSTVFRYFGILPQEYNQIFVLKEKFLKMSKEEKRQHYVNDQFVELQSIPTWNDYFLRHQSRLRSQYVAELGDRELTDESFPVNTILNKTVSIWNGDITSLEIDAIVNAANNSLLGGGGVDGAIHTAAGPSLKEECRLLSGCKTGEAKITGGYKLPAKHVIHTVGPIGEKPELLESCYTSCLNLLLAHKLTSIAFPCISTGVFGYPQEAAAFLALEVVRKFLDKNPEKVSRIIFCLFLSSDVQIYENLMQLFFPVE